MLSCPEGSIVNSSNICESCY